MRSDIGYDGSMKPILILKTGSTFPELARELGDFEDWVIAASGEAPGSFVIADGSDESLLPPVEQLAGIIITGSHQMVSDGGEDVDLWSHFLRQALEVQLPVLGICYGHQLLGQVLGGEVGYHPGGLELGQVRVEMVPAAKADPLFSVLPDRFSTYATHRQSVLRVPEGAFVFGGNSFEPHHAVRFAPAAWGVQFHPEFTRETMQAYIRFQRPRLDSDAQMQALLDQVEELPDAGLLLRHFCQLVLS